MPTFFSAFSQYLTQIQRCLFPILEQEFGPLTSIHQKLVRVLELVRVEEQIPAQMKWCGNGRPPADRGTIARSFVAKMTLHIPSTRALIDRLQVDVVLRRICGFESRRDIPDESTFSRAFYACAATRLPQKAHDALIKLSHTERLVGHLKRLRCWVQEKQQRLQGDLDRLQAAS